MRVSLWKRHICFMLLLGATLALSHTCLPDKGVVMAASNRSTPAPANALNISFEVLPGKENQVAVKYKVTNTRGEAVYVFDEQPPFVRLWTDGRVHLMSTMPELTEWMEVIAPRVPPVRLLHPGESLEREASYTLPLRDTFPYPAAALESARTSLKRIRSHEIVLFVGFSPSTDNIKLFDRPDLGGSVPGYYDLKRQFIARSIPVKVDLPVDCPATNAPNASDPNFFE